jgi:glycosyltransferase involved in cell wall biosynthesis
MDHGEAWQLAARRGSGLRVCMVAYTFYETDNRVMRYAETLAKRGDEVDVIAHYGKEKGNLTRNGVRVLRIQQRIPNERSKFTYLFRICLFFIRAMAVLSFNHLRKPYQLIHVHSVPDFLVFTAWLPKMMGAKIILDIHDLLPEFYATKFLGDKKSRIFDSLVWVERVSCAFADHVIVPNHLWQQRLQSRSVQASKCTVIMNYPDPSIFHRRGRTRTDNRFIILYPGTLAVHQGLDVAIRAFAKIRNVVPDVDFHIRGAGPAREGLEALVKELHLEDRVFFLPGMPMWEIAQVMEDADLAVVPKRKDSFGNEAFSTKTLEFMSLGVPLLISDTAVDLYYFNDQIVTFATSGDENDFAAKMVQLIRNPAACQKQVQNANEFAKLNSWDVRKAEYLNLVDTLTGNTPSPTKVKENVAVR